MLVLHQWENELSLFLVEIMSLNLKYLVLNME